MSMINYPRGGVARDAKERFEEKIMPEPMSGCWFWMGSLNKGYGQIDVNGKNTRANRFSYELYKGRIPKGLLVCHHCDVRSCVNPDHLFLGTHSDNINDMYKKGRGNNHSGELSPVSKLSESDVLKIRELRASGKKYTDIGQIIGTSRQNASLIARKINWSHI